MANYVIEFDRFIKIVKLLVVKQSEADVENEWKITDKISSKLIMIYFLQSSYSWIQFVALKKKADVILSFQKSIDKKNFSIFFVHII